MHLMNISDEDHYIDVNHYKNLKNYLKRKVYNNQNNQLIYDDKNDKTGPTKEFSSTMKRSVGKRTKG